MAYLRSALSAPLSLSSLQVFATVIGGLLMGYGARLAFGCNIGGSWPKRSLSNKRTGTSSVKDVASAKNCSCWRDSQGLFNKCCNCICCCFELGEANGSLGFIQIQVCVRANMAALLVATYLPRVHALPGSKSRHGKNIASISF